jgi:hypothetical protein
MTFPSDDDLRAAGLELRIARLQAEFDAQLSATWRGRMILRMVRLVAHRRTA